MSGRGSGGGPSRGAGGPTQTTWARDGVGAILVVLAVGLAFRLFIVKVYGGTGLEFDLASFRGWADNLASQGLNGFYQRDFFHDYTPGYLYVLYGVGLLSQALNGGAGQIGDLIKLPPILADVAIGWLVWSMAIELGASRRAALVGAAIAVANPVSWFDSVTWGQVDSFGVVFLLLGLRELWRDRPERAAIWTVIAALIKPQLGILIPLVAVVTIRRAIWPAGGFGRPDPPGADRQGATSSQDDDVAQRAAQGASILTRVRAWERRTDQPIRILTTALAGFLTAVILCAPFGLSVIEVGDNGAPIRSGLIEQVFKTTGEYPYVSVNAYNPWALAALDGHGLASDGTWVCDAVVPPVPNGAVCDTAVQFGPVPAVVVGTALLLAIFALVCVIVARRPDRLTLLLGLTVLAIAFFVVPTRVHERYLFPFIALGAILAGVSWRWLAAYVALSLAMFLNMYVVLTSIYGERSGTVDWLGIDGAIRSSSGVTVIAIAFLATGAWAFAQLRPTRRAALAEEIDAEGDPGWEEAARHDPWRDRAVERASAPPSGQRGPLDGDRSDLPGYSLSRRIAASGQSTSAVAPLPTWSDRPSFTEAGAWAWFRGRLFDRPLRADRSGELVGESGGRLDRLDAWVVVVLVVAILGLRIFRLAEPYEMHFDEVYHARTAAEFLQDWRYGISHDIYEWTHPHLAKYIMAGGLVAWGDDRVTGTSDLGVPVRDALVEPRRDDPTLPDNRAGDRLHVVTGSELRSYDLQTRELVATTSIAGADALAIDPVLNRVYVGTSDGQIVTVQQAPLDALRGGGVASPAAPEAFATADGAIAQMYATDDGGTLLVATADGKLETFLAATGERIASIPLPGIAGFAPVGSGPAVTAGAGSVEDPTAVASILAGIIGGQASTYVARLASSADPVILGGIVGAQQRADVLAAIKDGRLAGLTVEDVPRVAVAAADGVDFVDPASGEVISTTPLDGGAHGIAAISGVDDPKLYVTTGGTNGSAGAVAVIVTGGTPAKDGPVVQQTIAMPGVGTRVAFDDASEMVHVLGATPDGSGQTIYVIEPHGNAVFADARLPFAPVALAVDSAKLYPSADRQQILAFDTSGHEATVDLGKHAFAWRLPGVIAGALMAGLLYLLTRILFRRRTVALLVGVLAIADGMFFVQSRIGMNDAYVGLGIIAAYTIFAALWTGAWRWRGAFWLAMPAIGVLLGLALASKWVALYAIGALGLLILARSALGRLVLVGSLIVMTAILGHIAIAAPEGGGFGNLPFVAIMIGLTAVAAAVCVLHPIAWSDDEIRFAVGAPAALGVVVGLGAVALGKAGATVVIGPLAVTPLYLAAGLVVLSLVVYGTFYAAGRLGLGPLAPPPAPNDPAMLLSRPAPPPEASWLRPGALLGLPIVWMVACLLVLPIALYVASYLPWAFIEGHRITNTWPPGHTGQTLIDLTVQMYNYHNNLAVAHAADSPWWAWPFDLKPVWFYQGGFAGSTAGSIYDAGNLAIWWLGVPAMAFGAWQAYARRSLALALIGIGFACQWVSWARIDRAAFQYHYYTSLPFIMMGLAYLLAEVWHGASRRTWLLIRLSAAAAIMGPALLWLFDRPLCGFVGVERVNPGSQACPPLIPQFVLTAQTLGLAVVICVAVIFFLRQLSALDRGDPGEGVVRQLAPLGATAIGALVGLFVVRLLPVGAMLTLDRIPVEPVAIILGLPLFLLAVYVATARDARRFVIGAMVA
ncbi:MAG TPA: phospholipid carrier-dependent glycosyltransferase, partial [Methylomirabilota bacterium]|nr:phospholipid carrier-dependent glycosyltransferase [Methylomirabilota bacterium]